jgi:tRNA A-37 threonylcarbamoyl transferase component Bud32
MNQPTNFDLPELSVLPAGAKFGSYVIRECIGEGAMGRVYRAEHELLGKTVALKVMAEWLLASSEARQRFLREGQAAAAVRHPNVVDITDIGLHQGTPYLVMELLEGEDLESYLERHSQLDEREIVALALPIIAALGAAHERGVVHRDLKPSNIFLARGPAGDVVPKVLDFGVSKLGMAVAATDLESTPFDRLLGSPLYLAPEAVGGAPSLTAKSDQYSLGVLLYRCATGCLPFSGETLLALLNAIALGDFNPPSQLRPSLSPALERAIMRSMSLDPAQRFADLRELGSLLLDLAALHTRVLWGSWFARDRASDPALTAIVPASEALDSLAPRPVVTVAAATPRRAQRVWTSAWLVLLLAGLLLANLWTVRSAPEGVTRSLASLPAASETTPTRAASWRAPLASAQPSEPALSLEDEEPRPLVPALEPLVPQPAKSTDALRGIAGEEHEGATSGTIPPLRSRHPVLEVGANESPILD